MAVSGWPATLGYFLFYARYGLRTVRFTYGITGWQSLKVSPSTQDIIITKLVSCVVIGVPERVALTLFSWILNQCMNHALTFRIAGIGHSHSRAICPSAHEHEDHFRSIWAVKRYGVSLSQPQSIETTCQSPTAVNHLGICVLFVCYSINL